jgi:hypothetical protein
MHAGCDACSMADRKGSGLGCLGLPGMLAIFAFVAFAGAVRGVTGLLVGAAAVLIVFLVIGIAITQATNRD